MSTFNIYSMAFLLALVVIKGGDIIANILVHPEVQLEKNSYEIAGVVKADDGAGAAAGAEEDKLEPIEPLLATADPANGEKIVKKCIQCHSLQKGEKAKTGPNLWGIVGNKIAHDDAYAYSKGMKEHGGQWTPANLNAYLHKPRVYIPGTKMSFVGLKAVKDRADVIAYLNTLSDAPKPLS